MDQFIKDIELVGYTLRNMVKGFTLVTDFYWDVFFFHGLRVWIISELFLQIFQRADWGKTITDFAVFCYYAFFIRLKVFPTRMLSLIYSLSKYVDYPIRISQWKEVTKLHSTSILSSFRYKITKNWFNCSFLMKSFCLNTSFFILWINSQFLKWSISNVNIKIK